MSAHCWLRQRGGSATLLGAGGGGIRLDLLALLLQLRRHEGGVHTLPPQQRLVLSWSTLENVLAVVPPAQEPELQTGEVCESITCSAAYRDAMVAQMRPRAPQGRPAAERFFAEEAGGDLHDAILLGYQLHV